MIMDINTHIIGHQLGQHEDKEHWGVTWQDDPDTSYDDRFYWARDVARSLTDINVVDDDGNAVIDLRSNGQSSCSVRS